jgi:diguanylate cyclase (GGDEF)-like protein
MGVLATQELADFLASVADRPGSPDSHGAAVQYAVGALHAEAAAIVTGDAVTATIGFAGRVVPAAELIEVARGRRSVLEVPGAGQFSVATAPIGGRTPGTLVLARPCDHPFSAEEICLIRAMARVLELSLQSLHALQAQRRDADEHDRLIDSLRERQRLMEQLDQIQRAITRRAPLQQILDAITVGAQHLLDVEMTALSLTEPDDAGLLTMRSSCGVAPGVRERMRRVPVRAAGVTGLALTGDELVMVQDYAESPIAVPELARAGLRAAMAVPVHDDGVPIGCLVVGSYRADRVWDKAAQDVLKAFAEHVSLAVTDAQMLTAMQQEFHDPLTGLADRTLFLTRVQDTLAGGAGPAAVLIVDLDRFKVVNDSLGHAAGDQLLVTVAQRLRSCLDRGAVAARLGGDEFAVLLPAVSSTDDVTPIAGRILEALREPFDLHGREAFISSSIGIALSGAGGASGASDLMVRADLAGYEAKRHGDRYVVFEPGMQEVFQAHLELESDLRRAVVRHEFELRYQPIVHLRTGDISGFEALVRWQHPTRGIIAPLEFIPVAEETGLIVPIGEWVLREACRQAARWNARRPGRRPLTVSVNLSAVQLDQPGLPAVVADALDSAGLPGQQLVLELTESMLVDHRESTVRQLETLKDLGVRLAIDDFGTGYSSLAYLRRFPVDIIKIDKSFVDDVGDIPAASALTLGIIQLGRALRLSTIAEGIEHADQLSELTDGDCDLGQGYYFAEPLTEQDMTALLTP